LDGRLDKQARSAIAQYQKDAGLTVTGQASSTLLDSLRASSVRNDSDTLSQQVWQVEALLDQKGYRVGPIDGTLDAETREGIEDFQKDAGLKVTGRSNDKLLASLQNAGVSGGSINQLTARQVWELEVRLDALGYDVGAVDQVADSRTHAGVLDYQRDQGLPPTGRIDQSLLQHLQQADASQQRNWSDLSGEEKGLVIMQSLFESVGPQTQ
jgi:peptidoglycan hydrolase-like protein with peptidoglycan-binding domain